MIYFVQAGDDGPIKIGRANNVSRRLATLQCGCPAELRLCGTIEGDVTEEGRIQRALSSERLRGEWFNPTPLTLAVIDSALRGDLPQPEVHREIVRRIGTKQIAHSLNVPFHTVASWASRNSIPGRAWRALIERRWATFDELLSGVAA